MKSRENPPLSRLESGGGVGKTGGGEATCYTETMKQMFLAEIKKVQARKLVSNDIEVSLTVATDDTKALDLGKIPSDQIVKVTVETEDEA